MKTTVFKRFATPLLLGSALAITACASETEEAEPMADEAMTDEAMMDEPGTIVEVAQDNPDFSTLVSAVTAADLGETLSGEGPYTVFAPTDEAFDALPEGTLDTLLMEENQDQLSGILTYHVVEGSTPAADLATAISSSESGMAELTTVNGATLEASTDEDGNVVLTDATGATVMVTTTDVMASNGVIHVIDGVLMPE